MVQAGAVMTMQNRKELTYVPRLENPYSCRAGHQISSGRSSVTLRIADRIDAGLPPGTISEWRQPGRKQTESRFSYQAIYRRKRSFALHG